MYSQLIYDLICIEINERSQIEWVSFFALAFFRIFKKKITNYLFYSTKKKIIEESKLFSLSYYLLDCRCVFLILSEQDYCVVFFYFFLGTVRPTWNKIRLQLESITVLHRYSYEKNTTNVDRTSSIVCLL